jgi:pimeloyl-ACP methyl ester carboxylesterase
VPTLLTLNHAKFIGVPEQNIDPPQQADRSLHRRTVTARDGVKLQVETAGDGPAMVLCNGLYCSTHYFVAWIRHFSARYRVVEFDYRGHGQSADPPIPSRVALTDLVDDAEDVVRATCEEPAILVGHSMGVRVALELYDRAPHRFRCLVLLCGSVFDSLGPIPSRYPLRNMVVAGLGLGQRFKGAATVLKQVTLKYDLVSKVGYGMGGMSRTLTPREPVEGLLASVARLDIDLMSSLGRSYIAHSALPILPRVTVPTLIVVGSKDSLALPAHAHAVARSLRIAEVHVCDGCTHLAPVERPDEVHQSVDSFLQRHLPQ